MLELRHVRPLTVGQVEDGFGLDGGHDLLRHLALGSLGLAVRGRSDGLDIDAGIGHHAGGQHHQIGLGLGVFVEDQILELDRAGVAVGHHLRHHALGEDHTAVLRGAVEVLAVARGAQIGEQHDGIDVRIAVLEVHGLLDAGVAAEAGAVLQVGAAGITLTGTLHEHHGPDRLAVGRPADRLAFGGRGAGQCLQPGLIDHVGGLAIAEFRQLAGVVQIEAGGLDDGTDVFLRDAAGLHRDLDLEAAGRAVRLGDGGVEVDLDVGVGLDARDQIGDTVVLGRLERFARRHALVQAGGPAAQRAGLLHQHHLVTGLGRFQRRGHAGHAATDHQQGLDRAGLLVARRHGHGLDFGTGHAHVVFGHLLRGLARLFGIRTDPDHTFAQVAAAHRDGGEIERLGLGTARTGADGGVGDALVVDVVADHGHAVGGAQEIVLAHDVHLAGLGGHLGERGGIQADTQFAALADVSSSFRFSHFFKPPRGRLC